MALEPTLSPSARTVARFLASHPDVVAISSAMELGARTKTSNATVIRTVKALGYKGLLELRQALLNVMVDRLNPSTVLGQQIERLDSDGAVAQQVLVSTAEILDQAGRLLEPEAWRRAVDILSAAESVLCYGIEEAGCVAEFLSIELTRSGKPSRSMTATGLKVAQDLLPLSGADAVVLVAPLRHFREIDVIVDHAKSQGSPTILISEALGMALEARVDVVLTTPQTTLGLTSPIVVPIILVRALALEIASRDQRQALKTHDLLNRLRAETVGAELDLQPPIDYIRARSRKVNPT